MKRVERVQVVKHVKQQLVRMRTQGAIRWVGADGG